MQIGSVNSSSAASQAASSFSADDAASPDFANLLAGSYAAKASNGPELKGPQAARSVERTDADRNSVDRTSSADRAYADRASADRAADRSADADMKQRSDDAHAAADKSAQASDKRSDRAAAKQSDKPADASADAASAKPADAKSETPEKQAAGQASGDAAGKPGEAGAEGENAEKKKAEAEVDPLLLVAAPVAAATVAVAAAGHAAAAVGGKSETAADAALRALQEDALSPEAQQAALEAAKNAAQNAGQAAGQTAGKGDGKADAKSAKLTAQVTVDGSAPKSLVDPAALFADMLHVEGEEALPPELAAEMLGEHGAQIQNQLAGGAMVFDLANQPQNAAGNSSQQPNGLAAVAGTASHVPAQAAHQTAHAQAARHPQALVPPGEQVAVHIKRAANEGLDTISIKLDPGNLGKVEVTMEVSSDGRLLAVIAADKPETLAMLQKDAQALEQSLRDSGLKTGQDSLNFMLREQNQNGQGGDDGRGRRGGRGQGDDVADAGQIGGDARMIAQAANAQRAAARGGLDIRI